MFNSWMAFAISGLLFSQLIIFLVTIYFHRSCSHRAVTLSSGLNRICRFLAWFLISMDPQEFAAVHRKHHAKCDTAEDPHSPVYHKWYGVLFGGLRLYRREASNPHTIEQYGKGLPKDPWEGFYQRHRNLGIFAFAGVLTLLLGWKGLLLWGALMIWIPFWAAGVINGLGHHVGYRNFQTEDHSTNLYPWAFWVGGEELHNNHHAYPSSAKFSQKWWEFDIGWMAIVVLRFFKLAQVREASHQSDGLGVLVKDPHVWLQRFHYSIEQHVAPRLRTHGVRRWKRVSRWYDRHQRLSARHHQKLKTVLADPLIHKVHELEADFRRFWKERGHLNYERLEDWKRRAKDMQWPSLSQFVDTLPSAPTPPLSA